MTEAIALALINAMAAAATNAGQLAQLYKTLRAEKRDPNPEEWAVLDNNDANARAAFQDVIDLMPEDN